MYLKVFILKVIETPELARNPLCRLNDGYIFAHRLT
jgi:hypothetical protein